MHSNFANWGLDLFSKASDLHRNYLFARIKGIYCYDNPSLFISYDVLDSKYNITQVVFVFKNTS